MRAGLSTIQQTLSPEAAAVLADSIAEAAKRNHGQTTPLHVAATLLSSPSSILRRACIRSHPNSSHPLQCRALELCFSVALDRLPSSSSSGPTTSSDPPISNALMAALKRAQAHQRRGCPEQQQSPLLAVKVDLEQLVVSILDDPSISRVMKEARFSSPAVKASIETSISPSPPPTTPTKNNNVYLNPRLQQNQNQSKPKKEDVDKVLEILNKKHNAVLVGDTDLNSVMKEVIDRIKNNRVLGCSPRIISLDEEFGSVVVDKAQIPMKIRELGTRIDDGGDASVVISLGDLKWLVEGGQKQIVSDTGRAAVAEMGAIVKRSTGVWLLGTAACATYLRCQVYHPTMETDWDLQAVPIAPPRSQLLPGLFPRIGKNGGILSSSIETLAMPKGFPPIRQSLETAAADTCPTLCAQCKESYERELSKLTAKEVDNSSLSSRPESRPALPKWLQIAAPANRSQNENLKQNTDDLLKRWRQTCSRMHLKSSNLSLGQPRAQVINSLERPSSPPVKTDLVLGSSKTPNSLSREKTHADRIRNVHGCKQDNQRVPMSFEDSDSLKRLFKGLVEKVGWQVEAASAVTSAIVQSKSGNGKRRGVVPKGDTWLLFAGPDKTGKRKMSLALSELVFGTEPIMIGLGSARTDCDAGESDVNYRGKTPLDRIASSIRQNPFSVIVLEDVDQADALVRGTIKRAIDNGRLRDSYGREVSLGSAIFILTTNWLPDELKESIDESLLRTEEKILNSVDMGLQLEISVGEKRRPDWLLKTDQPEKRRKEALSLDLNLAAGGSTVDEDSDLTFEHEQEHGRLAIKHSVVSSASEFLNSVDNAIAFKPVDFGPMRRRISDSVSAKFTEVVGSRRSVQMEDSVLDWIVGSVWTAGVGFDEWAGRFLVPQIEQLKDELADMDAVTTIRLSARSGRQTQMKAATRNWLQQSVTLAM